MEFYQIIKSGGRGSGWLVVRGVGGLVSHVNFLFSNVRVGIKSIEILCAKNVCFIECPIIFFVVLN